MAEYYGENVRRDYGDANAFVPVDSLSIPVYATTGHYDHVLNNLLNNLFLVHTYSSNQKDDTYTRTL